MAVVDKIAADIVQPDVGQLIVLYELHLTDLGGSIYRFVQGTDQSGSPTEVVFDSETYYPRAFDIEGFGFSGKGQQPRPVVKIADVDNTIHDLCMTHQDMLGAVFKRRRTLKKYLDNESEADPTAEFPVDIFIVGKKGMHSKIFIEFELYPYMDKEGRKIPGRLILKDICQFVYRSWNGSSFDYNTERPCPYTTATYFKRDNSGTGTASEDECSHTIGGCRARYGTYGPMPFGGYPGVNRLRI
jgi:lambda family phage minor tail protein L